LKRFLLKKLLFIYLVTGSWLFTPIYFVAHPKLEITYINLSEMLTPNSVTVRGYNRSDGSYVSSYTRRPPGAVYKDKPIEKEMSKVSSLEKFYRISLCARLGCLLHSRYIQVQCSSRAITISLQRFCYEF
jgi:hypothetical protein